ncbi:MAG: hypothetical protein WBP34_16050, partial [Thermoanaerobaculia bacterium]
DPRDYSRRRLRNSCAGNLPSRSTSFLCHYSAGTSSGQHFFRIAVPGGPFTVLIKTGNPGQRLGE